MEKNRVYDWFLRLIKGAVIGMDILLPGISGAALAVVFGLYERIVQAVAHVTRDFVKNAFFFLPVGCGALFGIYLVSHPISFLLSDIAYKTPFYWFFIGAVLGTVPELWRKSGEKGRKPLHIGILAATFILAALFFLLAPQKPAAAELSSGLVGTEALHPLAAFAVGGMFAFVAFIPGFSSSTFLLLMGLYESINGAIKARELAVLVPFALGVVVFAFPFSKGIEFLLKRVFTGFFHVIIGFVLASAVLIASIASKGYDYMQAGAAACLITFAAGGAFSYWMCKVSKKYGV